MVLDNSDPLPTHGRRSGMPMGWMIVSWVVVGLAAYGLGAWWNKSPPSPAAPMVQSGPASRTITTTITTLPAPVAPPAAEAAPAPAPRMAAAPAPITTETERAAPVAAATVAAAPVPAAPASANVTKCVINGVVTFSDEPCSAAALPGRAKDGGRRLAAAPVRIERKVTCEGHEEAIRQIDLQAGTTENATELAGLALRRKQHRDDQFRMRC